MNVSRRQILAIGAGATAAWIGGKSPLLAADQGKLPRRRRRDCLAGGLSETRKIPVGLELWSVRDECEKNLPGVLKAVAQMGYSAVEPAHSYYGHTAAQWRKLLDENHLKSCGMHLSLAYFDGDGFQKTVEFHKAIGTPYLIASYLDKVTTMAGIKAAAKRLNEISDRLQPHGMKIGYHCHGADFAKVEGTTPWEAIAENTKSDVIMQMDVGNCLSGGGDPIAMLKKYPGRTVSIHIKDYGGKPGFVFGEGKVKWDEVFQICETTGGTKVYIVEEEGGAGAAALDAVKRALANVRKLSR
jgi:sugar phosphate isomerase/epimerase